MKSAYRPNPTALLLMAGSLLAAPLQAALVFTFGNAGVQSTTVAGVITEDFEGALNNIGTLTGGAIANANQFGGAGGTGKFLSVVSPNTATLTLNADQNYLGLWWSAGDINNVLSLYDAADNLLGTFQSSVLSGLPASYYGNPTPNFLGQNSAEAYAYLNFTVDGSTNPIRKVVFGGSNFEVDNISVTQERVTPPGNPVSVPDGGATFALLSGAIAGLVALRRKLT